MWDLCLACRIFSLWHVGSRPLALGVQSLSQRITREIPGSISFTLIFVFIAFITVITKRMLSVAISMGFSAGSVV